MTRPLLALLAVLLLAAMAPQTLAQGTDFDRFEVSLVTIGPGQTYWQRFGHNAILVRDRNASNDPGVMYNYGLFDFEQQNFFLKFIRGHMIYKIAAFYADQDLASYVADDRDVTIQSLNLSSGQKRDLIEFLEWNRRPENADYDYDYFLSNCSTRLRDVLDRALTGQLKTHFSATDGTGVFRDHVQRLTSPSPALYFGTGLGLGQSVDRPVTRWDEFFLPMELMRALEDFELPEGGPLVGKTLEFHRSQLAEPENAPNWLPLFLFAGLLLAAIPTLARNRQAVFRRAAGIWYLLTGLTGLVLALLWLLTNHHAAWYNENLLLFSPLGLFIAGPLLFARSTRFAVLGAALIALVAVIGMLLKLGPWMFQDNLEFAALVLPLHLVCTFVLLRDQRQFDSGA